MVEPYKTVCAGTIKLYWDNPFMEKLSITNKISHSQNMVPVGRYIVAINGHYLEFENNASAHNIDLLVERIDPVREFLYEANQKLAKKAGEERNFLNSKRGFYDDNYEPSRFGFQMAHLAVGWHLKFGVASTKRRKDDIEILELTKEYLSKGILLYDSETLKDYVDCAISSLDELMVNSRSIEKSISELAVLYRNGRF